MPARPDLARPIARAAPLLLALSLAGCGGAEGRVRDGLVNAGLTLPMATCMARPMAKELSLNQLLKLRSLGSVSKLDARRTSLDQLLRKLRALNDPQIVTVTTTAAIECAFR